MTAETLPERLRRLRTERGLSGRELAEAAGFGSRCTVTRFESGLRTPNAGHLQHLSDALGVSVTYLISGTDTPPEPPEPRTGSCFLIQGKPKDRGTVQAYSGDATTIRRLARQYGLTTPELVRQMLDYCLRNMSL